MPELIEQTVIDEDFGRMIDLILSTSGVKRAFFIKGSINWVDSIDDEFLREGLLNLSNVQLIIIESFIFKENSIGTVSAETGYSIEDIMLEVREMRKTLLLYI